LAKVIAPILRAAVLRVQEEIGKGHHVHEAVQRAMPRGTWEANFKKKIRPVLYALALAGAQHEWNLWAPRHRFQVVRWLKAPPDPLTHRIDMPPDIVQAVEEIADGLLEKPYWQDMADSIREKIIETVNEGVQEGLSGREVADKLEDVMGEDGTRARAMNTARTECLTADSVVNAANVTAVYRRWYEGPMVQLVTEHGRKLTGTPNHPMLTPDGWRGLGDLQESDYLLGHGRGAELSRAAGHENVDEPPATLGEIFDSLAAVWVSCRERTGQPDFHGDGRDGYVDVFRTDRVLQYGRLTKPNERTLHGLLSESDARRLARFCDRTPFARGFAVDQAHGVRETSDCSATANHRTADGARAYPIFSGQDRARNASGIFSGYLDGIKNATRMDVARAEQAGACLAQRAGPNAGFADSRLHGVRAAAKLRGNSSGAQTEPIKLDRVLSLRWIENWHGHVYNLTTCEGYFVAGSLYTGNTTGMLNGGQQAVREKLFEMGVIAGKEWSALDDERTRETHADADGQIVQVDQPFVVGGEECQYPGDDDLSAEERCNCLLPGTVVEGVFDLAMRSVYDGQAVEIITASGRRLAVSPNHPVLTTCGLVRAGALQRGHKIIAYAGKIDGQRIIAGADQEHDEPATAQQVFQAFMLGRRSYVRPAVKVARAHQVDFHGDGQFTKGNIEIVRADVQLLDDIEAVPSQESGRFIFHPADFALIRKARTGTTATFSHRRSVLSAGGPCGRALPKHKTAAGLDSLPLQALRFGSAAWLNTGFLQPLDDDVAGNAVLSRNRVHGRARSEGVNNAGHIKTVTIAGRPIAGGGERPINGSGAACAFVRDLLHRNAGLVFVDQVAHVRQFYFRGHVFDFQAPRGWIAADGLIVSNCRCTSLSVPTGEMPGDEGEETAFVPRLKYSEDQPRDESGRFTSGGGGHDNIKDAQEWARTNSAPVVSTNAKEAASTMADAVIGGRFSNDRIRQMVAEDKVTKEEIAKNWSKIFNSKKNHESGNRAFQNLDKDLHLAIQNASNDNHSNEAFRDVVDKHGQMPIIFRNSEKGNPGAAEFRGNTAHVFQDPWGYKADNAIGKTQPGDFQMSQKGGIAAGLRHEYAHGLYDRLSEADQADWKALYDKNKDQWKKSISEYAASRPDEAFTESFAAMTDRAFSKADWNESAHQAFDWIRGKI